MIASVRARVRCCVLAVAGMALAVAMPLRAAAQHSEHARAVTLFEQSVEHYRAGRFDEASGLLREAYEIEPEPVLLYNLARALEGAGHDEEAATAYRDYLASEDQPTDAAAARARLSVLDARVAERRALEARAREAEAERAVPTQVETQPLPVATQHSIDPIPWALLGGGVLVLGAGGVLGGLMQERADAAQQEPVHRDAARALADAETFAIAADVCFGVGAVLSGIGLIWGIVDVSSDGSESAATLRIGPGSASLSWRMP